jgi:ribonuclease HII
MKLCGIEEAGRGPVIGPLVMAGVKINEEDIIKLKEMGVKDSKLLTPIMRESLFPKIKQIVMDYKIIILSAQDVDDALNNPIINLNWLEALTSIKIIDYLNPDKAILDCPSNNIGAYENYVKERIKNKNIKILAEHKADLNHTVVAAASILAKVTRDKEIENLKKEFNVDFGSGYPSDPKTKQFLEKNFEKYNFFRKTWSSYKRVAKNKSQKALDNFF